MDPDVFLKAAESSQATILGFDTESTGLRVKDKTDKLTGVSLSFKAGPTYYSQYLPFFHKTGDNLPISIIPRIQKLIESKPIVVHNLPHDIATCLTVASQTPEVVLDIRKSPMIYDPKDEFHMWNEELLNYQLDYLSKKFLGEQKYKDEIKAWTDNFGWGDVPVPLMSQYGAKDAELHLRLHEYVWPFLEQEELDSLWPTEYEFIKLMADIMIRGVRVNQDFCKEQSEIGWATMADIESVLGFSPSKPSELGPFLLEELKLPVLKSSLRTGKPSFDKNVMAQYEEILSHRSDKTAQLIVEYRGWQKTVSSLYQSLLTKLSPDGRIRPNFKTHGTKTTRLSCEDPALQCIPREGNKPWNGKAKQAFVPREGFVLVEGDYAQLEFRLECEYTGEQKLKEAFADPDRDVFTEMSEQLGLPRYETKQYKYATGYGAGLGRISNMFGVPLERAEQIRTTYRSAYPGIYNASKLCSKLAEDRGYIRYWTGRRRHLHPSDSSKAFNSLMQGGAAEVVKRKMLEVNKFLDQYGGDANIVLQVHDSIWLEVRPEIKDEVTSKVSHIMTDLPQFTTNFEVDFHSVGGQLAS
jgi:DNA polymerase-1